MYIRVAQVDAKTQTGLSIYSSRTLLLCCSPAQGFEYVLRPPPPPTAPTTTTTTTIEPFKVSHFFAWPSSCTAAWDPAPYHYPVLGLSPKAGRVTHRSLSPYQASAQGLLGGRGVGGAGTSLLEKAVGKRCVPQHSAQPLAVERDAVAAQKPFAHVDFPRLGAPAPCAPAGAVYDWVLDRPLPTAICEWSMLLTRYRAPTTPSGALGYPLTLPLTTARQPPGAICGPQTQPLVTRA